jgi:hypothetical protein
LTILAGGGLLLLLGPSMLGRGSQRRPVAAPVYLSRASGQAAPAARAVADMAALGISGPETITVAPVSFEGGVRRLAQIRPVVMPVLPELGVGESMHSARVALNDPAVQSGKSGLPPGPNMPSPMQNFAGLDKFNWGAGYPPDTNGDVGPNDYVQAVNTSIGIFSKTGNPLATFTFDALFASAGTGTPCDTNNNGDPVALYDAQANRFIVADFAWTNIDDGPYYECIAASKTGDPVSGGWWLYAVRADDDAHPWLNDYPKLGVWSDGIYMSANMFDCVNGCGAGTNFAGVRVWALNRDDLYSGAALRVVRFDAGPGYFTLLPSNLRATATPVQTLSAPFKVYLPAILLQCADGPNYFVSNDQILFALDVFKFHVDWCNPSASTFTGPTLVGQDTYSEPSSVPESSGAPNLDSLGSRLMMQNQYRNINGNESLWIAHTADNAPTGIRWYQVNVTGGTVATTPVQQGTYSPDANYRWMPSLAVDRLGNMAVGYSVSSSTQHPDIRYAGRLAGDPLGTLGQGETTVIVGKGSQTSCFAGTCSRWGDYSAMTVDPVDDCTFWYTTEYYVADGGDWQTRIASFRFPAC